MEVNTKLKEMEEEIKVLKAEIRNVLLDIREVILERTNPLDEGHETATIRMDLHTTTSAMAAEAAAHEARQAMEAADAAVHTPTPAPVFAEEDDVPLLLAETLAAKAEPEAEPEAQPEPIAEADAEPIDEPEDEPPPKVIRRDPRELKMLAEEKTRHQEEVPPMYRADVSPISGNGSLSTWLANALEAVGPQELHRIISVHRSWGNLPPNINRALAYLQEMLEQTEDTEPAWLRVMQELDSLASL